MRALSFRNAYIGRVAISTFYAVRFSSSTSTNVEDADAAKATDETHTDQDAPVSQEAYTKLEKELEEAKKSVAELKKEVLYRAADAENARRIAHDDVEKAKSYGITSFGKDMLDVVDTLEKGLEVIKTLPESELESNKALSSIHTGVKLSVKLLLNNFAKHGIERLDVSVGDKFDPNLHDALLRTPPTPETPAGHISSVLKSGYKIKGRVLRAPQVGVASED
ncbi:putative GrpE [Trypanosoma vivax]|uniref:Putative co-chaperone n=1 Tax=Trypanosoma vivax (strain Y486) TaxID=1055687 RepID=G0TWN8_TRYVY|nr:putative co-chaperone [Trypanosoma vivax]KAH8614075.1 putative GrpE [Trypanosoma vivax]CCC48376.1 putative co-chaperone [Trypanosoma vivax Y486]